MRIALFGRAGQVATELQRRTPMDIALRVIGRDAADFSDPEAVYAAAQAVEADAVINAVAYTAVDQAEKESDLAHRVNAISVGRLGQACAERGLPLIHISTDYVFPGHGTAPWRPDDKTGPLNVYGASKLAGEQALQASGAAHAILRTSWVFSAHGGNFVKTMLRLTEHHDRLTIVHDQIGGPTPAADIADACLILAHRLSERPSHGVYHFSGAPEVSWADFAREIFRQAGQSIEIANISTAEFPRPAPRPLNSRLECSTLEADFGIKRPDWRVGLRDVLEELQNQSS